jgi:hypothetical protein
VSLVESGEKQVLKDSLVVMGFLRFWVEGFQNGALKLNRVKK